MNAEELINTKHRRRIYSVITMFVVDKTFLSPSARHKMNHCIKF